MTTTRETGWRDSAANSTRSPCSRFHSSMVSVYKRVLSPSSTM
ncbi:hypothetical protein [Microbacterium sp. NIBRBAC000506063]|nr:hypothetical protein [Microbacterium sp. NIBRBAC000506063]